MSYYLTLLNRHGITLNTEVQAYRASLKVDDDFDVAELLVRIRTPRRGAHPTIAITDDGRRICCRCKVAKPREAYTRNKNKADGLDARCRECKSIVARGAIRSVPI